MYGAWASPSALPVTSPRNRSPGQPVPPSARGASVCNQYRTEYESSRARCTWCAASGTSMIGASK
jgi:hypothetical protein